MPASRRNLVNASSDWMPAPGIVSPALWRAKGAGIQSDEALTRFLREAGINLHHPVGTCRMGEDPMAVVDSRLRVRGLEGLRVIDASVMPTVTTGNTNAPSIMIGEKGAAMIREDAAAFTTAAAAPSRSAA